MIAVGEHLVLIGEISPAAVHKVDAWQMVFLCDFLRAEVFFDGHRKIGTAFDSGIVAQDHHVAPHDLPNPGDYAC